MDEQQAKTLGALLKVTREELKPSVSRRELARKVGMTDVSILRLERGELTAPAPDKLARIAEALGLSLADVYALADYAVPTDLPNFKPYLRTKYRNLPQDDIERIEAYASKLAKKHGVSLRGPAPGEDE